MSSIGQDEHETLETLFQNVDLSIAETQARQCFHTAGPGRPPRNPLGLIRAFIVMRMKEIRSLRELTRILNVDQRIRRLCLIEDGERGYPRSVLSRFTKLVGAERLRRIIDEKVVMLLRRSGVEEVDVILDASFIKAWSIRHPGDSRRGFSDPDARVGRHGRGFEVVDRYSILGSDLLVMTMLKKRISSLNTLFHGEKINKQADDIRKLWKGNQDLREEIVELRITVALLRDKYTRATKEVEVLRSEKEFIEVQVNRLRSFMADLQKNVEEVEALREEVEELWESAQEGESLETEMNEILDKINNAYTTDYETLDDAVDFLLEEGLQD